MNLNKHTYYDTDPGCFQFFLGQGWPRVGEFFALFFLSLLVVTQIRDHMAGSSPPLPTTVRALHFYREKISALSSLVESRRLVLIHARRSQQLILFKKKKNQDLTTSGIRTHRPTLLLILIAAFEGYH